jgi:hypothetical protein
VSIKTAYATLKDFFCRLLGVPTPNPQMHVLALKELAQIRTPPSPSEVKQSIILISSMDPTRQDLTDLWRSNIFSVKTRNGQRSFTNAAADFAIIDRSEYGSAFAGQIAMLDYSIEEVRACRSLLLALDLKRKHLSELVEEKTTVQGGEIDHDLSHNFQLKAYAIFR